MAGRFAARLVEDWLDQVEAMEKWFALFTADPHQSADPLTVELTGDGYTRTETVWTRTGPNLLLLAEAAIISDIQPGTTVVAAGFFDAAFNGQLVASDLIPGDPVSYPSGGTYVLPAGEYALGIDVSAA